MSEGIISPERMESYPPDVLRRRVSAKTALAYLKGELSDLELLGHGITNMDPQEVINGWDEKHGPTTEELYEFCIQFPDHSVAKNYLKWRFECVLDDISAAETRESPAYKEYLKLADALLK